MDFFCKFIAQLMMPNTISKNGTFCNENHVLSTQKPEKTFNCFPIISNCIFCFSFKFSNSHYCYVYIIVSVTLNGNCTSAKMQFHNERPFFFFDKTEFAKNFFFVKLHLNSNALKFQYYSQDQRGSGLIPQIYYCNSLI